MGGKVVCCWGFLPIALVAIALGLILTVLPRHQPSPEAVTRDDVTDFVQRHWRVPIPPQGAPPAAYSPLESSLHPKECGVCHPQQYQDWQTSLHSRSMGPGVYGQLLDMDPATVTICATCHTPLSEQLPHLEHQGAYRPNPDFDAKLQTAGLVCAACHVRQHQHFGPPRRPDLPAIPADTVLPHGGFTAQVAFQRSEFCKGCHQFNPDDFALNGKLLENTYEEWRQSAYAEQGIQCQDCHMPDRRHLWRGIHDADMVKQAMTVTITPTAPSYKPGEPLQVKITVANIGAGHYLPTYVTPKIFVHAQLIDAQGQSVEGSAQQMIIGRDITLNLSQELYDTRIPPNGSRLFTYVQHLSPVAKTLRVRVVVHPDHFYQRFFEAVLEDGGGGTGRAHLKEALRIVTASSFPVFERDISLSIQAAD
ncbi:hypothetical protein NKDENANG_03647 [Candidatus Entotheonellaceae bacterium PAL068K]